MPRLLGPGLAVFIVVVAETAISEADRRCLALRRRGVMWRENYLVAKQSS